MNNCLCIKSDVYVNPFNRLSPSDCNFTCEDNTDVIYSGDCGGIRAYNIYEIQEGTSSINDKNLKMKMYCHNKLFVHVKKILRRSVNILSMHFLITFFYSFSENFNTKDTCLSLQCSREDKRFIPKPCSESLTKVCEKFESKFLMQYH